MTNNFTSSKYYLNHLIRWPCRKAPGWGWCLAELKVVNWNPNRRMMPSFRGKSKTKIFWQKFVRWGILQYLYQLEPWEQLEEREEGGEIFCIWKLTWGSLLIFLYQGEIVAHYLNSSGWPMAFGNRSRSFLPLSCMIVIGGRYAHEGESIDPHVHGWENWPKSYKVQKGQVFLDSHSIKNQVILVG